MCGIVGIADKYLRLYRGLDRHIEVMNEIQHHRGPDDKGVWTHPRGHLGFGHKRLSIIDLEHGKQPMSNGRVTVTYNGEIYNYRELREELSGAYTFRTHSDTEVILAAYEKWGERCVEYFRGMFAFALWDEKKQKLFCARDRFGIKPFYYAEIDGVFYFASEAKAILPFVDEVEADESALKDYLYFQFYLENRTLFRGIKELQPAHTLTLEGGRLTSKRYWEVYYEIDFDHTAYYFQNRLDELIRESVELHIRSDVPVGAYASGGIDSSITTAYIREILVMVPILHTLIV